MVLMTILHLKLSPIPDFYNILRINNPDFINQTDQKLLKINQLNFILSKLLKMYHSKYYQYKLKSNFSLTLYRDIKLRRKSYK